MQIEIAIILYVVMIIYDIRSLKSLSFFGVGGTRGETCQLKQ